MRSTVPNVEWAGKFVDERDYLRELENTERFRNLMLLAHAQERCHRPNYDLPWTY